MKATDKNLSEPEALLSQRHQSQIVNPKSEIEPHPLKQWLDHYGIRTEDLAAATKRIAPPGLHRSFIRHIYGKMGACSKKSALKLSKTTTMPAAVIMFPEDFPDFDVTKYKPINIDTLSKKYVPV